MTALVAIEYSRHANQVQGHSELGIGLDVQGLLSCEAGSDTQRMIGARTKPVDMALSPTGRGRKQPACPKSQSSLIPNKTKPEPKDWTRGGKSDALNMKKVCAI